ncbi:MAG TPA: FecR domain-containing protein [Puia sp.]|nr:FecR domain-containing protein [Puia sp.]
MRERPYSQEMLELGEKWMAGTITPEEKKRLFDWYDGFDDTELSLDADQAPLFNRLKLEMLQEIRKKIRPSTASATSDAGTGKVRWMARVSIAAAAIFVLAVGGWFFIIHGKTAISVAEKNPATSTENHADIGPGSNKATLTLADGTTVTLDSAGTGNLAQQGNARVIKNGNGQIQYAATNASAARSEVYNLLSTPRGGQYRLKLQDGTDVWLNAASSIRYPTAFTGKERRVEITGEAYFEVAKNAGMPFRVSVTDAAAGEQATDIEVLGTEFNVNAYKDETDQVTTLIAGSVRVTRGASAVTLRPSQQAVITTGAAIKTSRPENIDQIIAWKNGAFEFDDADVPTIMRQISRWYDVDVQYEGKRPEDRFSGTFSRNTSLAGVLQILHISGVRLAAENKKIVIKS